MPPVRVSAPADKVKRQSTYPDALQTRADLSIFYGRYQLNPFTCRSCGHVHNVPNETMTDVNIAVELMQDAFHNNFDTALLVSADSDLVGPVVAVQKLLPQKRVIVACPPNRYSGNLCNAASGHLKIGRVAIAKSLFPKQSQPGLDSSLLGRNLAGDRIPAQRRNGQKVRDLAQAVHEPFVFPLIR
jgi:hypothetical protein